MRLHRAQHEADGGEQLLLTPVIRATGVVMLLASEYTNFGRSRVEKSIEFPSVNATVPPTGSVSEKVQFSPSTENAWPVKHSFLALYGSRQ